MKKQKVFQYKIPRSARQDEHTDRLQDTKPQENFVGTIQGMKSSDLEERSARSLDKRGIGYDFRSAYIAGRNLPGEVELDFAVDIGGGQIQPVQIDGEFAHGSTQQKSEDRVKDAILNDRLANSGALPVIRISFEHLQTQEQSDATWDRVLRGELGDFISA